MFRLSALAALFGALIVGFGSAHAQNQAPQYWVTYAYDPSTGAWGLGWGRTDRQVTINEALSRCAKPGCKAGNVTLARCIAIAQGTQKGPGFGSGNDANTARANALRFCQQGQAGSTCEVTASRCGGS